VKNGTKKKNISVLHCNTEYPTPFKDVNLKAMVSIKNKFNIDVGYSDHTLGFSVPIAAVALGASTIEKHFTLNKNMIGPDHKASLEAKKLKELVQEIRNAELSLGSKIKKVSKSEKKNIKFIRKSIHTKKKINKNQILSENDLHILRPEGGLHPKFFKKIIGKKSKKNYSAGEKFYG
jgi:sialic acid synthase SpsE